LVQLGLRPLILSGFKLKGAKTAVEKMEIMEPGTIDYGSALPAHLLIYQLTMAYSILHPTIVVFGLVYFVFGYVVMKNQVLMVYTKSFETGGSSWHRIFRCIIISLAIAQATLVGVMAIKQGPGSIFLMPLLFMTYFFNGHFKSRYAECVDSKILAREVACQVDEDNGGALDAATAGLLHASFTQPEFAFDLKDIIYQTSTRARASFNITALPRRDSFLLALDANGDASDVEAQAAYKRVDADAGAEAGGAAAGMGIGAGLASTHAAADSTAAGTATPQPTAAPAATQPAEAQAAPQPAGTPTPEQAGYLEVDTGNAPTASSIKIEAALTKTSAC